MHLRKKKTNESLSCSIIHLVEFLIFDKFYAGKLPNWKKRLAILSLEGISKIKQLATSEGLEFSKLAKKTIVLIDSDKRELKSNMPKINKEIIGKVHVKGGTTFILRKREIENYVHPAAIDESFFLFDIQNTIIP